MTNNNVPFMCIFAIYIFSFVKHLFNSCVYFKLGQGFLFLISLHMNAKITLDPSKLPL